MKSGLLETSTISWGELVGNGRRLEVPPYQRNYAWSSEQWADLWDDLRAIHSTTAYHYMGAVVLQAKGERLYSLIDGQQRLTTLALLAFAIVRQLEDLAEKAQGGSESEQERRRATLLTSQFLAVDDPTSLRHEWKLSLNRHCNSFFQNQLLCNKLPQFKRGLSDPHQLLWEAFEFFQEKVRNRKEFPDGESLAHLLNNVASQRLLFIQVKVEDEVSAYTVFETLNARGTELTPTDLLKNYLFSLVNLTPANLDFLESAWESIGAQVGWADLSEFLRHYVISTGKFIREKELFREIKQRMSAKNTVREFLETLEREAEVYAALKQPGHECWQDRPKLRDSLAFLEELSMQQCLPVLLAGYRHLTPDVFQGFVELLSILMFRFSTVGKRRNNAIEPRLAELATALSNGSVRRINEIRDHLSKVYPPDNQFIEDFSQWAPQQTKKSLTRKILARLQNAHGSEDNLQLNIEHLLPQSRRREVPEVSCLGNLVLVEREINRNMGDKGFIQKLELLSQSRYFPAELANYLEWGAQEILSRQRIMATKAASIWKF